MPKRKPQFNEELRQKHPFLRKGLSDFEADYVYLHLHSAHREVNRLL